MAAALVGTPTVGKGDFVTSITFSHVVPSGSNRLLVVVVVGGTIPTSVTYGGVALTQARADGNTSLYYLIAPTVGTDNVVVSGSQTQWEGIACNLTGIDQTTPVAATAGHAGSFGVNVSDSIAIPTNGIALDGLWLNAGISTAANGTQTAIVSNDTPGGNIFVSSSWALSGSAMGWTHAEASNYSHSTAAFSPSSGGGGVKAGLNFFYRKTNGNL